MTKSKSKAVDNPKHAMGVVKTPLHYIPPIAIAYEGAVMKHGADKYGPYNWTESGVVASIYYDAAMRHLMSWYTGEDNDPDSGISHLAHVRACMAILIDCLNLDNLSDDRPKTTSTFPAKLDKKD